MNARSGGCASAIRAGIAGRCRLVGGGRYAEGLEAKIESVGSTVKSSRTYHEARFIVAVRDKYTYL